jgi:hypothetical protein
VNQVTSLSDAEYDVLWGHSKQSNSAIVSTTTNGTAIPKGGCTGQAGRDFSGGEALDMQQQLVTRLDDQGFHDSESDPQVSAVERAWSQCMKRGGYSFATPFDAMASCASASAPSAAEISQAKADVACKQQTKLIAAWVAVETRIENQLIASNRQTLALGLQSKQQLLKKAVTVLGY